MTKRIILSAILFAGIGFLSFNFTTPVMAQIAEIRAIPAIPSYDMPAEDFLAQTEVFKETPFGDKYLAYTLRLPKGWTKTESSISNTMDVSKKLLGEIASYYGPANLGERSTFMIQAAELEYQMTAKNWFTNYIFSRGYTLQGMTALSDRKVEALYVALEKDVTYIVRAVVEVNGSRIVMGIYSVPEVHWMAERAMQTAVLKSFNFPTPEPVRVEETRTYAFLDLLRFDYPKSWRLMAPSIYSIEAMDAKIINSNQNGGLEGEVDVHVISTEVDTTLAEEVKRVQSALETKGLMIGKLIEQPQNYKMHDYIYFSRVEVYQANDKEKDLVDYEYWIGVLMEDRYFYIVTMLTPSRNTDFPIWSRNGEAFKTVLQSLRP